MDVEMIEKKKIAVIGDLMLDRYWFGGTERISPEAPVPVVNIDRIDERLGGAANVALNIRSLGAPVTLVGLIGDDPHGRKIEALCHEKGIDTHLLIDPNHPTTAKLRIVSKQQHILRCDFEEYYDASTLLREETQRAKLFEIIDQHEIIILSDYGKGFLATPEALIQYARKTDKIVLVDPKGDSFEKYRGSSLITPNRAEFEAIVGVQQDEQSLLTAGESLRKSLNLEALLVTRSEEGMTLFEEDNATTLPARSLDVFDVTGAGDTVIATTAYALAEGHTLLEAAKIANTAASIVIRKMGAAQVSREELDYALGYSQRAHHQVLALDELLEEVAKARAQNEIIVMTNGCFDILHRGHVLYLEAARKLGHRLIVALNSDASVRRLKGENRPVMDEVSRATVMATLASVDWVILFDEDDPAHLIETIQPDILVKGDDYAIHQIKGADSVLANGGRVELIKLIDGYSTTRAIEKIQALEKE